MQVDGRNSCIDGRRQRHSKDDGRTEGYYDQSCIPEVATCQIAKAPAIEYGARSKSRGHR